jgi:drug/metabolite transporter (DMT)-like permease
MIPYVWIVFGFGGIVGMGIVFATGTPVLGHPVEGYFWLLMLTLIPQLIGHSGFNYAVGFFSATFLSVTGQSLPIISSVLAFLTFGEVPGVAEILGSSIILTGVIIAILGRSKK